MATGETVCTHFNTPRIIVFDETPHRVSKHTNTSFGRDVFAPFSSPLSGEVLLLGFEAPGSTNKVDSIKNSI